MNCDPLWTGEAGWRSARPGLFTGIVEEVPQVGGWPLRQHVVMLVGMDDKVRGLDSVRRHHLLPALECLVIDSAQALKQPSFSNARHYAASWVLHRATSH